MRPRITVYLTDAQLEYLRREAAKRRRSLSSYVTDCLLDYHVQTSPPPPRAETSPAFNVLLRDMEERLTAELSSRTSRTTRELSKQLSVLTAMLDRFVLSSLVHTPEVPEANRARAVASGERRYRNWREAVKDTLDEIGMPIPQSWDEDTLPAKHQGEDAA